MSTSYKATLDGQPVFTDPDKGSLLVRIWDLGPTEPEVPAKPELPKGKEGSPEHDLALIEFRGELSIYEGALKDYGKQKKDFAEWHRVYGGPYEFETHSVNAREAIQIEPNRYMVSDNRLPNHGLPKGRKPGRWHAEEQERQADIRRAMAQTMARDPIFGTGATQ